MKLFTEFLANLNKEKAGDTYRPANGTEGDMFFAGECDKCIHESDMQQCYICPTEGLSLYLEKDSPTYPIELQYGKDGQPCCRRKTLLPTARSRKTTNESGKKLAKKADFLRQGWKRALMNYDTQFNTNNNKSRKIIDKFLKAQKRRELHIRIGWAE